MNSETPPQNLERLLERREQAGEPGEPLSIECRLQATDERSFGALLLVPGLLGLSPLSGVTGLPSSLAVMASLTAVQLRFGRERFRLP
ncbi:MAG TPA: ABC transporter permease, partial [Pseudomonas sp.]|nr:ABC transporter permease [Pseudomonas sp.]